MYQERRHRRLTSEEGLRPVHLCQLGERVVSGYSVRCWTVCFSNLLRLPLPRVRGTYRRRFTILGNAPRVLVRRHSLRGNNVHGHGAHHVRLTLSRCAQPCSSACSDTARSASAVFSRACQSRNVDVELSVLSVYCVSALGWFCLRGLAVLSEKVFVASERELMPRSLPGVQFCLLS